MTSKTLKSAIWLTMVASAVAMAAPGGGKGPPDDKGNKPTSEVSNSLSVPAIMAASGKQFAINCPTDEFSTLTAPTRHRSSIRRRALQGWRPGLRGRGFLLRPARRRVAGAVLRRPMLVVDVIGAWGDNLAGDSTSLKVGSPIRVEFVLLDARDRASSQARLLRDQARTERSSIASLTTGTWRGTGGAGFDQSRTRSATFLTVARSRHRV